MTDSNHASLLRAIHDADTQALLRYVLRLTRVRERPSPDGIGTAFDKWTLSDALMSLSADHRTAVVRAYYLGETVADTAAHEQIPEAMIKSRLHYALLALRIALQQRVVVR